MPTFCLDCNYAFDEYEENSDGRQPCPLCNSQRRRHEESLSDTVSVGTLMHTKGLKGPGSIIFLTGMRKNLTQAPLIVINASRAGCIQPLFQVCYRAASKDGLP